MRTLYIIEFSTRGTSWYWAKDKREAMRISKEADEATDTELTEAEIWTIDEAICKEDLRNHFNRYMRPLLK